MGAELPVGSVVAWCGSKDRVPQGWYYCDGRVLEIAPHQALFDAIGHSFRRSTTSRPFDENKCFCLPDFRGYFLRGVDDGAGRDPDAGSRHGLDNSADANTGVGSVQEDQFRSHTHGYHMFPNGKGKIAGSPWWQQGKAQTDPAGGNETRPINAYVYYIVKAQ
ncbi:tail fiber protein [Ensifer adhaerens]|uniref:tail fiber protein n=1 Tax=Ensifer adhaerens TaxID=106592 RepID=UPI000CF1AD9A|nr:phage tail protein [Ensifer adhaerens]